MQASARFLTAVLFFSLMMLPSNASIVGSQTSQDYASSNAGIDNIQTSLRIKGPASEPVVSSCNPSVEFKGNAESMLLIDPTDPNHLIGASHFIYKFATGGRFSGSVGVHTSSDGGITWENHLISAFDCLSFKGPGGQLILRTYDPVVAMDMSGNLYAAILPDYQGGGDLDLYVAKSTDGGKTWSPANGGKRVHSSQGGSAGSADKQWIIVDNNPQSRFFGSIYVVWVSFYGYALGSDVFLAKSNDKGETFSIPVRVNPPRKSIEFYAWPIPAVTPDGKLYISMERDSGTVCDECTQDQIVAESTDGGMTFSSPTKIATVLWHSIANTAFRAGIYQSFAVNPLNGHLILALENFTHTGGPSEQRSGRKTDILLYESSDGKSWSEPLLVNDNPNEPTNQFQPVVAVSPHGLVAVAFYDRRLTCPNEPGVLKEDVGKENFCIDTSLQFYTDDGNLKPVGSNIRVSKTTWDPNNSGSIGKGSGTAGGKLTFIGDYFGLALTDSMAFPFFTANYDLGENPAYDLQIYVARVKSPVSPIQTTTMSTSTLSSTIAATSGGTTQVQTTETTSPTQPLTIGSDLIIGVAVGAIAIIVVLAYMILKKRKPA